MTRPPSETPPRPWKRSGRVRESSLLCLLSLAHTTGCTCPPPRASPPAGTSSAPSLVIVLADDLGYGDLGCFASDPASLGYRTPHLDRMAREGVRFTDFHSNGAVCSPTRAALMTGRYQQRSGITGVVTAANHRHTGMALSEVTLAEALGRAGYATGLFGKWHLGYDPAFGPNRQGFEVFRGFVSGNVDYRSHVDQASYADWWHDGELLPEEGYLTDLLTDHALAWIDRQEGPFLAVLAHGAPHYPYQGPDDPAFRVAGERPLAKGPPRTADRYAALVESLDANVGRVLEHLERSGRAESTLVIFCSDNGPASVGSAGPFRGRKGQVWEGGHRVPAVAWWPGRIPPGEVRGGTAMTMDLMPTALSLAGIRDHGLELDGVDLAPCLLGKAPLPTRDLFFGMASGTASRRGRWKAVRTKGAWQLFDLERDPGETTDLAGEQAAVLSERLRAWHEWRARTQGPTPLAGGG